MFQILPKTLPEGSWRWRNKSPIFREGQMSIDEKKQSKALWMLQSEKCFGGHSDSCTEIITSPSWYFWWILSYTYWVENCSFCSPISSAGTGHRTLLKYSGSTLHCGTSQLMERGACISTPLLQWVPYQSFLLRKQWFIISRFYGSRTRQPHPQGCSGQASRQS